MSPAETSEPVVRLLSPEEAAAALQVPPETLRYWRKIGRIHAIKMGKHVRYDARDLRRFVDSCREVSVP